MISDLRGLARGCYWSAAGAFGLLMAVSGRHGFHRDEMYFVEAGRRLDWGYVDQPPLTPLVARLSETVGLSPSALRIVPAVAVSVIALISAAMARRMGGGRVAQIYASITVGFAGVVLGEGHLLSTAIFDFLFWTLALWVFLGILDGVDPRNWLILGGIVGVGLQNKHLIGFLAVALLIGLLMSPQRRLLWSRWPWVGVLIALVVALPNLVWQAANHWPQLEMAEALRARSEGALAFVLLQPGLLSIALAVPAGVGLWRLLRAERLSRFRPVAVAYLVLFLIFLVIGAKAYYIAPMYSALLASGAVWFEELSVSASRWMTGATTIGIGIGLFIALPLLPVAQTSALDLTGELGETVGWPELVDQVAGVYASIPEQSRSDVLIFTGSYGEAGAINLLGAEIGLPRAYSGHNNHWLWGPPGDHGPIIGVGRVEGVLTPICPNFSQVDTITNPWGVENEELGLPLLLCLSPERQLSEIWQLIGHYN